MLDEFKKEAKEGIDNFLNFCKIESKDNVEAQYLLGVYYFKGIEGLKSKLEIDIVGEDNINYQEAFKWFLLAAQNGNSQAMNIVGVMYANGIAKDTDEGKAKYWYEKGSELNNVDAIYNLALLNFKEKNIKEAIKYFQKGRDLKHIKSIINLANIYANGIGIDQNEVMSFNLYKEAVDLGDNNSIYNLAILYFEGKGVEQNYQKAIELLEKGRGLNNADCIYFLGTIYREGLGVEQDYNKTLELYKEAAKLGNTYVLFNIGMIYQEGLNGKKDINEAIKWFLLATEYGDSDSMNHLGLLFLKGKEVNQDSKKAFEWFTKASMNNNPASMYYLGKMYESEENFKGAKELYLKALEHEEINDDFVYVKDDIEEALKRLKEVN